MLEIPAAVAGPLLKNGATLAKEPVRKFLAKKTLRRRVAKKTVAKAELSGIDVSRKKVRQWLGTEVAAAQLGVGTSESLSAAVDGLRACGTSSQLSREDAARVLDILLGRFLRESETHEAIATGAEWVGRSVEGSEARLTATIETMHERVLEALGTSFGASDDVGDNLARLHPWRREKGAQLLREHRPLAELLQTLVSADDRNEVLRRWAKTPPPQLDNAPGLAWTWLGELASDYSANRAASHFYAVAAQRGAEPHAYWLARAAASLHGTDDRDQAVELLDRGADQHPLGRTIRAELDEDVDCVLATLLSWQPEDQASTVIRAVGIARTYVERDELNLAITTLSAVVDEDRRAAGAAVELGKLLLHRSRSGRSDHAVTDANRALSLAVQARDARRSWGGDSSDAVVLAVRAAALLGDIDRAWNLTQADGGEATAAEAQAESVRREAAVLASLTGRQERASELAAELDDQHVSSMNDAFAAMERGDEDAANAAWAKAFAHASTDSDRLATAMYLAEAGAALPDLSDLRERHPEQVREIDVVHEVMSTKGDRIATLRARVHESTRLAIALATHYTDQDQPEKAAQVLVDAGDRHREALLMRMGAERYIRARKYADAQAAAEKALALGGSDWPGEYDARAVLHDAMMGQADTAGAFAQAQALVALAPDDRTARWALVGALMRRNDGEAAWRALCPDGVPIDPRSPQEAWLWVELAAEYDHGPRFVPRVLAMLSAWPDDEDLRGSVLARMFFALRERDDADPGEREALREAAEEYQQRWPDSPTFRAIQLGPDDDPLGPLTQELEEHAKAVSPLLDRVKAGELPVGTVAAIGRTYTEAVVSRAAGMVRSFNPGHTATGAAAIDLAREQGAVIDTSAMGTLVTLDDVLRHQLLGSLSRVETSEGAYADALAAQASLGTRSTMTLGFDPAAKQPRLYEISEEEAELLATRAAAIANLAGGLTRRSRVGPSRFERADRRTGWLEAYEIAREAARVFWCDDAVLANVARNEGIATFSTVDLLRAVLVDPSDKELLEVAEGTLVANYHVDLGFNADVMRFAAEFDHWAARGAAFALSRPYAWEDAEAAGAFLLSALDRHGDATSGDLAALREWTAAGAIGLLSAAPDDERASGNARILLNRILARPWLGADQLAAVVRGIRAAIEERPGAADPLVPVLREFYSRLVQRTNHGLASKLFISLVRQLPEADRQAAAHIVLEND